MTALQLERQHAARLEEAQRNALYGDLYELLATYHVASGHAPERVHSCKLDAQKCRRFAIAIIFGPELELEP